jgi:hypothetical protein
MNVLSLIIGQALLGWLFADFVGGLLHFVEDQQLLPTFLDRQIGLPNRLHHADPQSVTRDPDILRRNSTTIAAALPLIALVYAMTGATVFWAAASVGGLVSYEAHRWAHAPRLAPGWAKVLQEIGLFQSPKHHALHHRPPHSRGYCILSDWLNPVLDEVGFWRLFGLRANKEAA